MMASNNMLTQLIQDAVLKLCTQHVAFTKSLELDGIICVSPGNDTEIVVKMHRTIVKPETPIETQMWHQNIQRPAEQTIYQSQTFNKHMDKQSLTISHNKQDTDGMRYTGQESHGLDTRRHSQTLAQNHQDGDNVPGGHLISTADGASSPSTSSTALVQHSSTSIKEEPSSFINHLKRSHDDLDQATELSQEKQRKLDSSLNIEMNIKSEKEEPITIELDDDDEDDYDDDDERSGDAQDEGDLGYDAESMAAAGWQADADNASIPANETTENLQNPFQWQGSSTALSTAKKHHVTNSGSKERPSCELCLKTFASIQALGFHMNIHTGAKPFSCDLCAQAFPHPYSLKFHKKSKHSINPSLKK